jgi:flagellar biosynthesis protein FlhG
VTDDVVADPGQSGRVIGVASGKGGIGKTWLAVTLAHAWARAGLRVLLCDGDLGLANVDVQLGLAPPGDLAGVVAGKMSLQQAVAHHKAGFDALAGRSGSGGLSGLPAEALETLLAGLHGVAGSYDRVLLDIGAGIGLSQRRLAVFADTLLVLVTDEPTSLTDAYVVLKLYARDRKASGASGAARAVVNQAVSGPAGERTYRALSRACQAFLGGAPPLAGVIRRDEAVGMAIRRQKTLLDHAPNCRAAADVTALARML